MQTELNQIVNFFELGRYRTVDLAPVAILAAKERLNPSIEDKKRVIYIGVDFQKSFLEANPIALREFLVIDLDAYEEYRNTRKCPKDFTEVGSIPIKGSLQDVENTIRFLYRNMEKITTISLVMECYTKNQIFYPDWWTDNNGNYPKSNTIISSEDIINGKWQARWYLNNPNESLEYIQELEKKGYKNVIYPYHCINGTEGIKIENELQKIVYFHSIARSSSSMIVKRKRNFFSKKYNIGRKNAKIKNMINAVLGYDEIYIGGESANHGVLNAVEKIVEELSPVYPNIGEKITILTDCTSPFEGFEEYTANKFEELSEKYGVKLKNSKYVII